MKGGGILTWEWRATAHPNMNVSTCKISCGVCEAEVRRLIQSDTNNLLDEIHMLTQLYPAGFKCTPLMILQRNAPRAMQIHADNGNMQCRLNKS